MEQVKEYVEKRQLLLMTLIEDRRIIIATTNRELNQFEGALAELTALLGNLGLSQNVTENDIKEEAEDLGENHVNQPK